MATISKTQFYAPSYFWYTLMTSEYLASSRLQLVTNDSIIYKIICPQTDMHSSLEANLKGFLKRNLKAPNQNIKNQEYLSLVGSRLGEELEDNKGQSEYVN
jgi:heme oxygenase